MNAPYYVISYYSFTSFTDPHQYVKNAKAFGEKIDLRGRVYVSESGINGQVSIAAEDVDLYLKEIEQIPGLNSKVQGHDDHVFAKFTIKYRKQLVAIDIPVDLEQRGHYLEPAEWREKLQKRSSNSLLIDVRNDYEWKIGHFEGAVKPSFENFREFPEYLKTLKEEADPEKTEIMMYCTGGIRCEYFSAYLKKEGFKHIYQLKGGLINYGLQERAEHWRGKLFVFDDRLVVPISDDNQEIISTCHHCETPTDIYYNCANMDCNELFLCCPGCLVDFKGCCCHECSAEGRVRPFDRSQAPKPFRRLSKEQKQLISK